MKIGYLGPGKSTFGYAAAKKYADGKPHAELVPHKTHYELCVAVAKKEIDVALVPIENSIDGVVNENIRIIDRLHRTYHVIVCGEVEVPIELFFLRRADAGGRPQKLIAQKVAKGQCSNKVAAFLKSHDILDFTEADSNGAAAEAAKNDPSVVAVGSFMAVEEYGLVKMEEGSIADREKNYTRFWVLGLKESKPTRNDKTCFLLTLDQPVPGGIAKILTPFAEEGFNMLLIAPISLEGRTWEYCFLIEFEGSFGDPRMERAYNAASRCGASMDGPLRLGSYPSGITVRR